MPGALTYIPCCSPSSCHASRPDTLANIKAMGPLGSRSLLLGVPPELPLSLLRVQRRHHQRHSNALVRITAVSVWTLFARTRLVTTCFDSHRGTCTGPCARTWPGFRERTRTHAHSSSGRALALALAWAMTRARIKNCDAFLLPALNWLKPEPRMPAVITQPATRTRPGSHQSQPSRPLRPGSARLARAAAHT